MMNSKNINYAFSLMLLLLAFKSLAESTTIEIPAEFHPNNEALISVVNVNVPLNATTAQPVPACIIVHGSGGLFSEGEVGEACDTSPHNMSGNFADLMAVFEELGVATIAPSKEKNRLN